MRDTLNRDKLRRRINDRFMAFTARNLLLGLRPFKEPGAGPEAGTRSSSWDVSWRCVS
jgi:hypothetical protein